MSTVPKITDKQVVEACLESNARVDTVFADAILVRTTGHCEKVCYRAMERAIRKGLIECGVSLRTAWPTDKGLALLRAEGGAA